MWYVQQWKNCYVAIKGDDFYRFINHARARAYTYGRNKNMSHEEALTLSEKETVFTV